MDNASSHDYMGLWLVFDVEIPLSLSAEAPMTDLYRDAS